MIIPWSTVPEPPPARGTAAWADAVVVARVAPARGCAGVPARTVAHWAGQRAAQRRWCHRDVASGNGVRARALTPEALTVTATQVRRRMLSWFSRSGLKVSEPTVLSDDCSCQISRQRPAGTPGSGLPGANERDRPKAGVTPDRETPAFGRGGCAARVSRSYGATFFRRMAPIPARPRPKSAKVAGSGACPDGGTRTSRFVVIVKFDCVVCRSAKKMSKS